MLMYDYPYLVKLPDSLCYQFYLAQAEEARYLKEILNDNATFSTFPRRLNGDVIVDCHPEYPSSFTHQDSDTAIRNTVFNSIFGNYASPRQGGKPIFLENGLGTCFTMIHFQQAMNSVIPGTTLRMVHNSDDILSIQVEFQNKNGESFCTERDFIKKLPSDRSNHLLLLRSIKIMWVMIDAIENGFEEFRAMIYGDHPSCYWSGLLEEAHSLAINHFSKRDRSVNFNLTLIKSPHFCSIIHEYNFSQRLHMDSAVAEFLGVNKCSYFCNFETTTSRDFINYIRSLYRDLGKDTRLMTLPQDGTTLRNSMIVYFTTYKDDILQSAKSTGLADLTVFDLLSFMGKKGYANGIGKMSAEEKSAIEGGRTWTVDLDDAIVRMIGDSFSYANIASELGNGLSGNDIYHRWSRHLKESTNIIKPYVKRGTKSRITWTADVDDSIVRMRKKAVSFAKIALELGNGLNEHVVKHRWNHLKGNHV
jgi:hypothetical protein